MKVLSLVGLLLGPATLGILLFLLWAYPGITCILGLCLIMWLYLGVSSRAPLESYSLPVYVDGDKNADATIFMIHGWPDNKEVWNNQLEHFQDHRIVRIDLPNFAEMSNHRACDKWGFDFDELSELAARALKRDLAKSGHEKAILMIHDWGSYVGMMMQRRYPELVSKMVILDVQWGGNRKPRASLGPVMITIGLVYQYWAMLCWITAVSIPVVGHTLGTLMMQLQLQTLGPIPPTSTSQRPTPISAYQCYPYFYFHVSYWTQLLGLRPSFDVKHHSEHTPMVCAADASVPVFFAYGADKPFQFHSPSFERKLAKRPGCVVVPLGNKRGSNGSSGKKRAGAGHGGKDNTVTRVGHWVQVTAAAELNSHIRHWLQREQ